ncbi:MAG: hypothetical protein ACRDTA_23965 [Pseudonocardiaceae bacterium]
MPVGTIGRRMLYSESPSSFHHIGVRADERLDIQRGVLVDAAEDVGQSERRHLIADDGLVAVGVPGVGEEVDSGCGLAIPRRPGCLRGVDPLPEATRRRG